MKSFREFYISEKVEDEFIFSTEPGKFFGGRNNNNKAEKLLRKASTNSKTEEALREIIRSLTNKEGDSIFTTIKSKLDSTQKELLFSLLIAKHRSSKETPSTDISDEFGKTGYTPKEAEKDLKKFKQLVGGSEKFDEILNSVMTAFSGEDNKISRKAKVILNQEEEASKEEETSKEKEASNKDSKEKESVSKQEDENDSANNKKDSDSKEEEEGDENKTENQSKIEKRIQELEDKKRELIELTAPGGRLSGMSIPLSRKQDIKGTVNRRIKDVDKFINSLKSMDFEDMTSYRYNEISRLISSSISKMSNIIADAEAGVKTKTEKKEIKQTEKEKATEAEEAIRERELKRKARQMNARRPGSGDAWLAQQRAKEQERKTKGKLDNIKSHKDLLSKVRRSEDKLSKEQKELLDSFAKTINDEDVESAASIAPRVREMLNSLRGEKISSAGKAVGGAAASAGKAVGDTITGASTKVRDTVKSGVEKIKDRFARRREEAKTKAEESRAEKAAAEAERAKAKAEEEKAKATREAINKEKGRESSRSLVRPEDLISSGIPTERKVSGTVTTKEKGTATKPIRTRRFQPTGVMKR